VCGLKDPRERRHGSSARSFTALRALLRPHGGRYSMERRLFGTDGIRGQANTHPMTAEVALALGKAAGGSSGASTAIGW
jgi:phosphomannomutase